VKTAIRVILILGLAFATFVGALYAFFYFGLTTKLQKLDSRDRKHTAELLRMDGIDRNYTVRVDGQRVYRSPDFAPRRDIPFRETLTWDSTGSIVILEVAGNRIFGYDTSHARALTDEQLLAAELPPSPQLWEYYFEAEWPGIGRVRPPERPTQATPK
jgi:hypothetical protein